MKKNQTPLSHEVSLKIENTSSSDLNSKLASLKVIVISDTHEGHPELGILPACDILIHAGDILLNSRRYTIKRALNKYLAFIEWLEAQPAKYKLIVGGNHDTQLEALIELHGLQKVKKDLFNRSHSNVHFLCNEILTIEEFNNLVIFGTCLSHGRSGNRAFQENAYEAECYSKSMEYFTKTQNRIDILITHGTCEKLRNFIRPTIMHVSGHVHEVHGVFPTLLHNTDPKHTYHINHSNLTTKYSNQSGYNYTYNVAGPLMNFPDYEPINPAVMLICHFVDGSEFIQHEIDTKEQTKDVVSKLLARRLSNPPNQDIRSPNRENIALHNKKSSNKCGFQCIIS